MLKIVLMALMLESCVAYSQKSVKIEVTHGGLTFRITAVDSILRYGDSLEIRMEIVNRTKQKFIMYDWERLPRVASVLDDGKTAYALCGGYEFDMRPNHAYFPLRVIKEGTHISRTFMIATDLLASPEAPSSLYEFYISVGYIEFSENLNYLTDSRLGHVFVQGDKDWQELVLKHTPLHLGNLSFVVIPN